MGIDYTKLDSGLLAKVQMDPPTTEVDLFVHTSRILREAEVTTLKELGVTSASSDRQLFTARIPLSAVERVSNLPWIAHLELAHILTVTT
jgi:hypothetical protein